MLFNTIHFFIFLFLVLIGYYSIPERFKNIFLTFVSWYFYSFWNIYLLSLLIISTFVDYFASLKILNTDRKNIKKIFLLISIFTNLGLLGFFKYFYFFSSNINNFLAVIGLPTIYTGFNIILPVGISFYTFQTLGYTIDVYRGDVIPRKKFFDFACYVSFFPQLVAGPIERANRLLPQLEEKRKFNFNYWIKGIQLIIWGLFKKIVIADNLAFLVEKVFDSSLPVFDTGLAVVATYAFAVQIYCDFSGYTDIARGVAKFFHIDLMENFNLPYLADSIRDFWKRWHISLSTWLRDYLYISLGGSKKSSFRTALNLLITMFLGGLWHGASWMFVLWGLYHGLLLVIERFFLQKIFISNSKILKVVKIFITFHLVCFSWVLFRAPTIDVFINWLKMAASFKFQYLQPWIYLLFYSLPLILVWIYKSVPAFRAKSFFIITRYAKSIAYICLLFGMIIFGAESGREFIYFQF